MHCLCHLQKAGIPILTLFRKSIMSDALQYMEHALLWGGDAMGKITGTLQSNSPQAKASPPRSGIGGTEPERACPEGQSLQT